MRSFITEKAVRLKFLLQFVSKSQRDWWSQLGSPEKKDTVFLIAFFLSKRTCFNTRWWRKTCSRFTPFIHRPLPWTLHLTSWWNFTRWFKKIFSYLIMLSFTHMNQTCQLHNSYPLTSNEQSRHQRNTDSPAFGLTVMSVYSPLDPPTSLCVFVPYALAFVLLSTVQTTCNIITVTFIKIWLKCQMKE